MKIIQIQNHPRHGGGADVVFDNTISLLRRKGEDVFLLERRSIDLGAGLRGKFQAFASGLYSRSAYKTMERLIQEEKPDIVHVHDLYPMLVWTLQACGDAGVPVVMTCHNYRLTCPALSHLRNGEVCEMCIGGHEYWCILYNCRDNAFESVAFALHNVVARRSKLFMNNVTLFIALTKFSRSRFEAAGVPREKLVVLPNMMTLPASSVESSKGSYAAFVGRLSAQKGIDLLLSAAADNPEVPVWAAGDHSAMQGMCAMAPKNVKFVGQLNRLQLAKFYENCRFVVVPSRGLEGCPMVVIEAMSYGLPVIASGIGSLKEMIDDRVTGMLFEPGNADDLSSKIRMLWENSDLCTQMGHRAREKAMREYDSEAHYRKLIALYEKAIQMKRN